MILNVSDKRGGADSWCCREADEWSKQYDFYNMRWGKPQTPGKRRPACGDCGIVYLIGDSANDTRVERVLENTLRARGAHLGCSEKAKSCRDGSRMWGIREKVGRTVE